MGLVIGLVFELLILAIRLAITLAVWAVRLLVMLVVAIAALVREHRASRSTRTVVTGARVPVDQDVRWSVFARDGYSCRHCGSRLDLTVDHIHPVVLGGTNDPANLQTLCRDCNSAKGARVLA